MKETASLKRARNLIESIVKRVFTMPEKVSVCIWADTNRVLSKESSSEYGKWETARTPYMLEIYNMVTNEKVREVVLMFAAQLAKTELILNVFGWYAHLDPCPMMVVQPSDILANEFSKERVAPMIRDCEVLKRLIKDPNTKNSGNTVSHKMFVGGFLAFRGANTPRKLASKPIRVLFMDEIDGYEDSSGTEGDPVVLAKKRCQTFWDHKIIMTSTPGKKEFSKIEKEYLSGSQAIYYLECPSCGENNELLFDKMIYETQEEDNKKIKFVKMSCGSCGSLHSEKEWKANNQSTGKWIHTYPDRKEKLSYKLNGFAGIYRTWESIMEEYLEIKNEPGKMQVFINTVLAETYQEEEMEKIDYEILMARRETYKAELPKGVYLLTMGIDIQDRWIAYEIVGHGLNEETYGIEYGIIYGSFEEPKVQKKLDEARNKVYRYEDGSGLKIYSACMDTGGHHTETTYEYVHDRQGQRLFGIKGMGGEAVPAINGSRTTKNKKPIQLWSLGVNALKDKVYSRLKIENNSENEYGYCHFTDDFLSKYDESYFKSLTAEVKEVNKKTGKVTWKKIRTRNEALDCRVYAIAARMLFNKLKIEDLAKLRKEELEYFSENGRLKPKGEKRIVTDKKGIEI